MPAIVFHGSEAEAAGWRLAGVAVELAPARDPDGRALDRACMGTALLLLDAATAARIAPARLAALRAAGRPLVCVLPAIDGEVLPDPVVAAARRQLGMDA
jgi:hypothetical protein